MENKGYEMTTLKTLQVEIQEEIKLELVDESRCLEIIGMGNMIKGYGLWLAKEYLHKDSNTGWTKFCEKAGVSRKMAYDSIEFYKAKSCAIAPNSLPNKEGAFRALKGETVDDKVKQYKKVKKATKKDEPTALDIKVVEVIEGRGIKDKKLTKKVQDKINESSNTVRETFAKSGKKAGFTKLIELDDNATDEEIIKVINGKSVAKEKFTPTEKSNLSDAVNARLKKLEAENKALKAENRELKHASSQTKEFEASISKFVDSVTLADATFTMYERARQENAIMFKRTMLPHFKEALQVLELPTMQPSSLDDVKTAYKRLAKKAHPDLGGTVELFNSLKQAYDVLRKLVK